MRVKRVRRIIVQSVKKAVGFYGNKKIGFEMMTKEQKREIKSKVKVYEGVTFMQLVL